MKTTLKEILASELWQPKPTNSLVESVPVQEERKLGRKRFSMKLRLEARPY